VINVFASVYLVIILAASLAAIPLMIVTGAGQRTPVTSCR
jgi:hypothetical protein